MLSIFLLLRLILGFQPIFRPITVPQPPPLLYSHAQLKTQARSPNSNPNIFSSKAFTISFYSKTPVEDINAESKVATSVFIMGSKTLAFQVLIRSFKFPISLMQEHFNESYLESEKFPVAKFKGIVLDSVNYAKDGVYPVRVQGVLSIHGVDKPRTIKGLITVHHGVFHLVSAFEVACADHHIKIPTIVFAKISEVIKVTVEGSYDHTLP